MTKDQKIAKLGKEITDRATVLLGKDKITPESPNTLVSIPHSSTPHTSMTRRWQTISSISA